MKGAADSDWAGSLAGLLVSPVINASSSDRLSSEAAEAAEEEAGGDALKVPGRDEDGGRICCAVGLAAPEARFGATLVSRSVSRDESSSSIAPQFTARDWRACFDVALALRSELQCAVQQFVVG
jgi:hypothetical protein